MAVAKTVATRESEVLKGFWTEERKNELHALAESIEQVEQVSPQKAYGRAMQELFRQEQHRVAVKDAFGPLQVKKVAAKKA
jgi:hypothetical protein